MKKKIFITGGSGLLAVNWAVSKRNSAEITLCCHQRVINLLGVNTIVSSLGAIGDIENSLKQINPDIVIHTAGITNVEECEKNPELAEYSNIEIAKNVAIVCAALGIKLVHISTDHLFDGTKELLTEEAALSPLNIYGATKAKAEEEVLTHNNQALIIRTNFYGWGTSYRKSFSDFIIDNITNSIDVDLYGNVFYSPILIQNMVRIVDALLEKEANGIYNVVSDDRVSKYIFGAKLARCFQKNQTLINIIDYIGTDNVVKRPQDMSLSNKKVSEYLGYKIGGVDEDLLQLKTQSITGIEVELKKL